MSLARPTHLKWNQVEQLSHCTQEVRATLPQRHGSEAGKLRPFGRTSSSPSSSDISWSSNAAASNIDRSNVETCNEQQNGGSSRLDGRLIMEPTRRPDIHNGNPTFNVIRLVWLTTFSRRWVAQFLRKQMGGKRSGKRSAINLQMTWPSPNSPSVVARFFWPACRPSPSAWLVPCQPSSESSLET